MISKIGQKGRDDNRNFGHSHSLRKDLPVSPRSPSFVP